MISIIVAISEDNGIGKNNDLLWKIPEDMKRFRKLTMGHCIIMGKRTWESLPKRPLQGRQNVVLTDIPGEQFGGATTAYSIEDALEKSKACSEIFIIGGGSVYRQFMPVADKLYITRIHRSAPADTWFPGISDKDWEIVETEEYSSGPEDVPPYSYIVYRRKR